jgi:hypothetical protein
MLWVAFTPHSNNITTLKSGGKMRNAAFQVEEEKLQDPGLPSVPLNITTTTQPSRLPESLRASQESTHSYS